jgi:hypothetical protein
LPDPRKQEPIEEGAAMTAPRHVCEHGVGFAYRCLRCEAEMEQELVSSLRAERDRFQALLLKYLCACGPTNPDPKEHDAVGCLYRKELEGVR